MSFLDALNEKQFPAFLKTLKIATRTKIAEVENIQSFRKFRVNKSFFHAAMTTLSFIPAASQMVRVNLNKNLLRNGHLLLSKNFDSSFFSLEHFSAFNKAYKK